MERRRAASGRLAAWKDCCESECRLDSLHDARTDAFLRIFVGYLCRDLLKPGM